MNDEYQANLARLKEINTTIDGLYDERDKIRDKILLVDINGKLKRIMDKWVLIPGHITVDENDETMYFRLAKVVDVVKWDGNNRFELKLEHLVYLGHAKKDDSYDHAFQLLMFTNKDDKSKHVVGNITKLKVISAKKAASIIERQMDSVNRRLKTMQNAALNDYAKKEM